ncbi:MAG: DUF6641 family protein, partial [Anaerolineales bacterium]
MSHLSKLTLSTKSPRQSLSPVERKRRTLIEQIGLQIAATQAALRNETYMQPVIRWEKQDGTDQKTAVTTLKPVRPWWWSNETGKVMLSIRVANRVLDIEPGKPAIEVGKLDDLPAILETLREAIVAGELDERLKLAATRVNDLEKAGKGG